MNVVAYIFKTVFPAIIIIISAFLLMRILERGIFKLSKKKDLPEATPNMLKIIARWFIGVITILVVATIFGVELTALWAAISAIVAMIAFGLFAGWSLISSGLAAVIIMIWRPYKVGDTIEILPDGIKGKVIEMSMMFTSLKDSENNVINIPNSQMLQRIIKKIPSL